MSSKINYKSGFTLIELLVVIAIIGLLSAMVLIGLNISRNKGIDAAVKSQLRQVISQSELFAQNNSNGYAGFCTSSTTKLILAGAANATGAATSSSTGQASTYNKVVCHDSNSAWALDAPLSWCVDSIGEAKDESGTGILASTYVCGN